MTGRRSLLLAVPVLVVAFAFLLLPLWFGREAQTTLQRLAARLGSFGITVVVDSFERGWLSSTADTRISAAGLPVDLIARHRISHGPILLDRIFDGVLRPAFVQARMVSEVSFPADGSRPLKTYVTVGLSGDGDVQFEIPAQLIEDADGATLDWRGMSAAISFDHQLEHIAVDLRSSGLAVRNEHRPGPQGRWRLGSMAMQARLEQGIGGHYFGTSELRIEHLGLGPDFVLRDLALQTVAMPSGNDVHATLTYRMQHIELAGKRYGPASIVVEARRLEATTLARLEKELRERWELDELGARLRGTRSKRELKVGDRVIVEVIDASIERRQIELALMGVLSG